MIASPSAASILILLAFFSALLAAIDMRLASGASVIAGQGTHRASNPTDFFEQARPNPPTIGAQEFAPISSAAGANFFHVSPF